MTEIKLSGNINEQSERGLKRTLKTDIPKRQNKEKLEDLTSIKNKASKESQKELEINNGEFDPGSG